MHVKMIRHGILHKVFHISWLSWAHWYKQTICCKKGWPNLVYADVKLNIACTVSQCVYYHLYDSSLTFDNLLLQAHQKQMHSAQGSEGSFSCKFCGSHLDTKYDLSVHEKSHATSSAGRCLYCPKTFRSQTLKLLVFCSSWSLSYYCSVGNVIKLFKGNFRKSRFSQKLKNTLQNFIGNFCQQTFDEVSRIKAIFQHI